MTEHIDRAIDLAQCAVNARTTGQPNLAALYEKNALESIREARAAVRKERIQRKPNLAFKFFAEDLGVALNDFMSYWQKANPSIGLKADYALAGPSKGSGS